MAQELVDNTTELRSEVEHLRRRVAKFEAADEAREAREAKRRDLLLGLTLSGVLFRMDPQNAVRKITETCSDLIGTERVSVWLYSPDGATLRCIDLYERSRRRHTDGQVLNITEFPEYTESHRRESVIAATDVFSDPRTRDIPAAHFQESDIRSLLDVPVWLDKDLKGVVSCEAVAEQRSWSAEDEHAATTMAAMVSLCFEAQERRQAENALRDSRQQLHDILEFLPDATFAIDRDGRIIAWNRAIEEMTGVPASAMIGKGGFEYAVPFFGKRHPILIDFVFGSRPEQESNYLSFRRIDDTVSAESHVCVVRGRRLNLWGKASPIRDTNGKIVGAIESIRDISSVKATEAERRRLTAILEGTSDLVGMATPDGRITYMNAAFRREVGWKEQEDVTARNIYDAHPAWVNDLFREEAIPAAITKGFWQGETAILGRSGVEIPVSQLIISHRSPDGDVEYLSTVMRDISERKRTEEALRESERRLKEVQKIAHLGSWYWDVKTGNVEWSEEVYNIFGVDKDTFKPRIDSILAFSPWPEDHTRDKELIQRAIESHESGCYEQRFLRPDKSVGYYYSTFQGHYDEKGGLVAIVGSVMDITDRKRMEAAITEQRDLLADIIEATQVGTWRWNIQTGELDCNKRWAEMIGYTAEELAPISVQTWKGLAHPGDQKKVEALLEKHFAGKIEYCASDSRVRHKDGSWVWVHGRGKVTQRAEDGRPLIMTGTNLDITARKRAEEAVEKRLIALTQPLDESGSINFEDLFDVDEIQHLQDLLAKAFGVATLIVRPDGTPITKPGNFGRLCRDFIRSTKLGSENCQRSDAMIGRPNPTGPTVMTCLSAGLWNAGASIMVGGRHIANWLIGQVRDETQTDERMRAYARELGADETEFLAAFHEVPCMSQEQFGRVAEAFFIVASQLSKTAFQNVQQARFITERRRAEEALRESEARFRDVTEGSPIPTFAIDRNHRIIAWNHAMEDYSGFAAAEMLGTKRQWQAFYDAERPCLADLMLDEVEDEVSAWYKDKWSKSSLVRGAYEATDYFKHMKDGRWLFFTAAPLRDAAGQIIGAVETMQDITERKQAEEERERLNRELDLKNRNLETTLYVASHDLLSPLVNIKGFSGELEQACKTIRSAVTDAQSLEEARGRLEKPLDEAIPRAVEFIGASVKKMDSLLAGLLRLSRLGQAVLRIETLDMNAMLADITKALEFQITERGCTVRVDDLPPCSGDASQINQVFSNLLDNALKYLDPARPGVINVRGRQNHNRTTYTVEDNGIGIAPEDQDRVFDVFQRVNPRGQVGGEGLGLTILRRILDKHGGTVRLESELGKGSRFHVSLPSRPESVARPSA